jgi:hypothetical protein
MARVHHVIAGCGGPHEPDRQTLNHPPPAASAADLACGYPGRVTDPVHVAHVHHSYPRHRCHEVERKAFEPAPLAPAARPYGALKGLIAEVFDMHHACDCQVLIHGRRARRAFPLRLGRRRACRQSEGKQPCDGPHVPLIRQESPRLQGWRIGSTPVTLRTAPAGGRRHGAPHPATKHRRLWRRRSQGGSRVFTVKASAVKDARTPTVDSSQDRAAGCSAAAPWRCPGADSREAGEFRFADSWGTRDRAAHRRADGGALDSHLGLGLLHDSLPAGAPPKGVKHEGDEPHPDQGSIVGAARASRLTIGTTGQPVPRRLSRGSTVGPWL